MNEEIIEDIEAKKEIKTVTLDDKAMTTWLIFLITDKKYAVRSSDVVEIISDLSIYHIPFMPKYIEGVLNRRGEPFTVVNPNSIFSDEPDAAALILKVSACHFSAIYPASCAVFLKEPLLILISFCSVSIVSATRFT